jgi:hypothetical protein
MINNWASPPDLVRRVESGEGFVRDAEAAWSNCASKGPLVKPSLSRW